MTFWLIICALAAVICGVLLLVLLRRQGDGRDAAEFDIAVYRDQLKEIDRDLERGVMSEDLAERARIEVSRRILDADKARGAATTDQAPRAATLVTGVLAAGVVLGGSVGLYSWLGAPGYGDLPLQDRLSMAETMRENRPDQAAAEAQVPPSPPLNADPDYVALVDQLRAKLEERPDDLRGMQLLAQNEANLGNYRAAHEVQARIIAQMDGNAPAAAYAALAEFYALAAGGYVSPEAEEALRAALQRDPSNGPARYYTGLMFAQTGRPDLAFRYWRVLLEASPPDAPWIPAIRAQIPEIAYRAGVEYTLPPLAAPPSGPAAAALPGPSQDDMSAAQEMAPEDRQAMIETMVEGLAARLANEGGTGAEWARLITALGVLGQTERAQAIYDEAVDVFAADPGGMQAVREAAARAGLNL